MVIRALVLSICALLAFGARVNGQHPQQRVRALDARTGALLALGLRASPTFGALLRSLQTSDVIAHVDAGGAHYGRATGETQLVTRAGGTRYLRVSIDAALDDDAAIALLGHELQHVSEIAEARWVVDQETLRRLYAQIGDVHDQAGSVRADTDAARRAGVDIYAEVRAARLTATN